MRSSHAPQFWLQLVAALFLATALAGLLAHGAPLSDSEATPSLESVSEVKSEMLVEKIVQSGMENECDTNQDRKDFCERCIRFMSATTESAGYLGCCTNYDGIHDFCEKFLNYSFDESPQSKASGKAHKTYRQK